MYRTFRSALQPSKRLTCLIFAFPGGGMPTKAFKKAMWITDDINVYTVER